MNILPAEDAAFILHPLKSQPAKPWASRTLEVVSAGLGVAPAHELRFSF